MILAIDPFLKFSSSLEKFWGYPDKLESVNKAKNDFECNCKLILRLWVKLSQTELDLNAG